MVKNSKVCCPYSSKHKMKYTRLIYHLAKGCPDMNNLEFEVCIYNWVHRVPKGTLEQHYSECEFKPKIVQDEFNADVDMKIWENKSWNFFLFEKSWPPDFFPDY